MGELGRREDWGGYIPAHEFMPAQEHHNMQFVTCKVPPKHDIFTFSTECGEAMVHRHCKDRAPPCKAHIASGAHVTMSRKKVIQSLDDIDRLGKFLLDKVGKGSSVCRNRMGGRVMGGGERGRVMGGRGGREGREGDGRVMGGRWEEGDGREGDGRG